MSSNKNSKVLTTAEIYAYLDQLYAFPRNQRYPSFTELALEGLTSPQVLFRIRRHRGNLTYKLRYRLSWAIAKLGQPRQIQASRYQCKNCGCNIFRGRYIPEVKREGVGSTWKTIKEELAEIKAILKGVQKSLNKQQLELSSKNFIGSGKKPGY